MLHRVSTSIITIASLLNAFVMHSSHAFISTTSNSLTFLPSSTSSLYTSNTQESTTTPMYSFIDTDLRGAAMKLHTRKQAPKEGQAPERQSAPKDQAYVTTHMDYLHFLVDSQYVFQALEDAVISNDLLVEFRNTGLERTVGLEKDIKFMMEEYDLERPSVGNVGEEYAKVISEAVSANQIPEFMCHYYNFYFAHTAGGRMIGKQMSALLLNKKTLEFYKWDGDINELKDTVKNKIEDMAAKWTKEEKTQCVDATAAAFKGGGGINAYLRGGNSPH